jgi:hypothetical protein
VENITDFKRYLQGKYAGRKINLIVVIDPILEPMAVELQELSFPDAKIVGVGPQTSGTKIKNGKISNLVMKMGVADTFSQMIRVLMGNTWQTMQKKCGNHFQIRRT